jgi:hypothetical protein
MKFKIHNMRHDYIKISVHDQFDYRKSIKGFHIQLALMQTEIYVYYYTFAVKRQLKVYFKDYFNLINELVPEEKAFMDTGDPFVIHGVNVRKQMNGFMDILALRFGLDIDENITDLELVAESRRFKPYYLWYKKSKSYKKLRFYYEKTLLSHIHYLFKIACVYTASSYRIPAVLAKDFNLPDSISFDLLDQDNHTVRLIIDLIKVLMVYYNELRTLNLPRPPKSSRSAKKVG